MCENVKFVWEGKKRIYYFKAAKFDTWSDMEYRKQCIEESIEDAKKLLDKMRKADEYGVLTTAIYWDLGNDVSFKYVEHENAKLTFGIKAGYSKRDDVRKEIEADPIKAIEKFIEDLKNELKMQKEFMKEAEPYLTIHIS